MPSRPRQYEFARLNLTYTVLSKRVLLRLVNEGHVRGWDDPRMPTISGLRRRGFPAEGIRDFAAMIGVAKADSVVEIGQLEHAVRGVLNRTAPRRFAVLDPLKVVIENYPEGQVEEMDVANNPEDPAAGTRKVPFTRELWIERDDFMEEPPAKFFRLAPGREVRLRSAYFVTCREVVKDEAGEVVELRCTYDPATRGGDAPDGRRPKATLHWVSAAHAVPAEVRLYDHLFSGPYPGADGGDLFADLNPSSETVLRGCLVEPSLADVAGRRRPSSSSGWATSARTPTRRRARSSSTGRSRSRTRGRSSRPRAGTTRGSREASRRHRGFASGRRPASRPRAPCAASAAASSGGRARGWGRPARQDPPTAVAARGTRRRRGRRLR